MRIGELAIRAGVSVRSLRYYEQQGMLTSERSSRGQRHYSEGAVERVRLIQQLYAAGLSSKAILELLPRVVNGRATPELLSGLSAERDRLDEEIGDLVNARARLDAVITSAAENARTGRRCQPR